MLPRPIFLVGFMCSGKSTLGRALAEYLGVDFIDLDTHIELLYRATISQIFENMGEEGFRKIEAEQLSRLVDNYHNKCVVIALGGGTPCRNGVMDELNSKGTTVYLKASVPCLTHRLLLGASTRPLAAGKSPEELTNFAADKLKERAPFYQKAHITFDSSQLETKDQIAKSAIKLASALDRNLLPST